MIRIQNHYNSKIKEILIPQGHMELMVFIASLFYYSFICFLYLQNRSDCVLPEMLGYDTSVHMTLEHKLINLNHLFSWDVRHPLMNVFFLPPIILDCILSFVGYSFKWEIFTLYSCLISSYSGLLLFKVLSTYTNKVNAILLLLFFFSFAHTILLSIQIDSFVLSLLFFLLLILAFSANFNNIIFNNILFIAIAGTTSTNILKCFLYTYFACKKKIRIAFRHILMSSVLFVVLLLFTIPDLFHRLFVQHLGIKYSLLAQTLDYQGSSQSVLKLIIDNFISEPLLFHNQEKLIYISETSHLQSYPSVFYYIPIIVIICSVLVSIVTNINKDITKVIITFLCVDIFIHFILSYGISEGQIFCAHWFFFIPISLALFAEGKTIKHNCTLFRIVIVVISLFFFYHNFTCYIHGF